MDNHADMDEINQIAKKYNLKVIVDGAQSFGSTYKGISDSNLGDISCTSFFPAKPLGCYGDGGALFTNDEKLADKIKSLRLHGQSQLVTIINILVWVEDLILFKQQFLT